MRTPIFFPCFPGDPDEQERMDKLKKQLNAKPKWKTKDRSFFSTYIVGKLYDLCGYDMPDLIDGTVPNMKYGDIKDCYVYGSDNIKHECILAAGYNNPFPFIIGIILLKNDIESFINENIREIGLNRWDFNFLMVSTVERQHVIDNRKLQDKLRKTKIKLKRFKEANAQGSRFMKFKDKNIKGFLENKELTKEYCDYLKDRMRKRMKERRPQ